MSEAAPRYDVELLPSITAIPAEEWRALAPCNDPVWHRSYFHLMEQHSPGPDGMSYVVLKARGRIIGIAPIFWYRALRMDLILGETWKQRTAWLRRWMPALFRMPVLFCGHPTGEGRLLLAPWADGDAERELVGAVHRVARHHRGLVIFKDFEARHVPAALEGQEAPDFFPVTALPETVLDLPYRDFDAYLGGLKRNARRNARSKMRKFTATPGMRMEVVAEFAHLVPEMFALYEQVYARAEIMLDHLTPAFFSTLALDPDIPKRAILCWHEERLVGFALCLFQGNRCVNLRVGQDYHWAQESRGYFMLHYETIRLALEHGCTEVRFCPTTYHTKLELGCRLLPLHHRISHTHPLMRALLRHLLPVLMRDFRHATLVEALAGVPEAGEG